MLNDTIRAWRAWELRSRDGDEEETKLAYDAFLDAQTRWMSVFRAYQLNAPKRVGTEQTPHRGGGGSGGDNAMLAGIFGELQRTRAAMETLADTAVTVRYPSVTDALQMLIVLF